MVCVFISHSSLNNESAARIKTWLAEQGFETPFLDYDNYLEIYRTSRSAFHPEPTGRRRSI